LLKFIYLPPYFLRVGHSTFISLGFLHLNYTVWLLRGEEVVFLWLLSFLECLNFCFFLYSLFIYLKINYCLLSSLLSSSRSLSWKVSYSSGPCRIFMDLVFLCVSSPHSSNFHFMNLQGSKELITLFRSSASSIVVTFGHHIPW
jgi:hypothetical protein